MQSRSFDQRLDRISWQPGARPSGDVIDSIIGGPEPYSHARTMRSALISLAGAVTGILIGVGLKGMYLPQSPWGPGTGMAGLIGGGLALSGLALSLPMALYAGLRSRRHPGLMQFASMNLLMIVVLLLS